MAFQAEIAGAQIDGARDYQEDAFLITHLSDAQSKENSSMIIVSDGMGGHAAGNVASNMAVQAFNKNVTANYPSDDMPAVLNESMFKANGALTETIAETPALEGMGCTMVGAVIEGNKLWWASVGDSHLYLLRNKQLIKLNDDHSYGGFLDRMQEAGTPVKSEPGLSRNMLMSALTGGDIAEIDCPEKPFTLEHEDKLIVCSDGVDSLSEGKLIQYAEWSETPKECSDALLEAVEEERVPRQDNTTAVVAIIIDDKVAVAAKQAVEKGSDTVPFEGGAAADLLGQEGQAPSWQAEEAKKSRMGLVLGLIFLLLIGGGGYFAFINMEKINELIASLTKPEQAVPEKKTVEKKAPAAKDKAPSTPKPKVAEKSRKPAKQKAAKKEPVAADKIADKTAVEAVDKPADKPVDKSADKPADKQVVTAPQKVETRKELQDDLKIGGKAPLMLVIPAGTFEMGTSSASQFFEERPKRAVSIDSIAVSKYEVTFAEYDLFVKATGRNPPKDFGANRETHPVVEITWDDAYNYTVWLSEQTGNTYRLLSESEWEYAASAGVKSTFWWGYDEEPGKAHCFGCDSGLDPRRPAKIGFFDPNPFGLHDTAGNVAEWVQDCWHDNYKGAPGTGTVWQGGDCSLRVVRGGSYLSPQQSIRSSKRDKLKSNSSYDHVGIRLARELN